MNAKTSPPHRVLVTGASGAVGTPVCRHLLGRGHHARGFALEANIDLADSVTGDLSDLHKVREAVEDVDTVIHLGAYPYNADFLDVLLEPNVRGLYHVCAAAVTAGVQRLVIASSLQVISGLGKEGLIRVEDGAAPTNHYPLTKVWAEYLGDNIRPRARAFGGPSAHRLVSAQHRRSPALGPIRARPQRLL